MDFELLCLRGVIVTPRAACARAGLSNWFCPSVVVVHKKKKNFITGYSESKSTSKRENNDEIRRILAYVYLVEHKAVLFSAFSTFF